MHINLLVQLAMAFDTETYDLYLYRKKKLHQKLVMSKMNAKKAAKLDMDDRAKILQYFSRPVGGAGDIAGKIYNLKTCV